jgi:hypothetical protein
MVELPENTPLISASSEWGLILQYPASIDTVPKMPVIKRQNINSDSLKYLGFQNTHCHEKGDRNKTVGFFREDERFMRVCLWPWKYVDWLQQYSQVLTPDVSVYLDMNLEEAFLNTYLNRYIGSYWQSRGLTVIPTVSWADEATFDFCFSGIETGSWVAVSTIKTARNVDGFMDGFKEMCNRIKPEKVICYCKPYPLMERYADIVYFKHEGQREREEKLQHPIPGQLKLNIVV